MQVHRHGHEWLADIVGEEFGPPFVGHEFEEGRAGKEDGRRLAGGAADLEDNAGQDSAEGVGEDNGADGLPPSGAQVPTRLPEGVGHRAQGLQGGGDDYRQSHDRDG